MERVSATDILEARTRRAERIAQEKGETLRRTISRLTPAELSALENEGLNLASSDMLTGRYRENCYFDGAPLEKKGCKMVCSNPLCRLSYVFTEGN